MYFGIGAGIAFIILILILIIRTVRFVPKEEPQTDSQPVQVDQAKAVESL